MEKLLVHCIALIHSYAYYVHVVIFKLSSSSTTYNTNAQSQLI